MAGVKHPVSKKLTPRERQVLALLAERWSSKEIAQKLGIGYSTVTSHIENIYRKLGVHDRRAAARTWEAMG